MIFFCNRSSHILSEKNNEHQVITYRSFKKNNKACLLNELCMVPWEIIENFDTIDNVVLAWTSLFTEALDKHAIKCHRIKRKDQLELPTPERLDLIKE